MRAFGFVQVEYLLQAGSVERKGLAAYFTFYNERRWHQSFDRKTPAMVYRITIPQKQAAA
jgi:hypothetical protein